MAPTSAWDQRRRHDLTTTLSDPAGIVPRGRRNGRSRKCLLRFKARPKARLSRPNPMHACSGFARQKPPDCEEKRDPRERHPGTEVQYELDPSARLEKLTFGVSALGQSSLCNSSKRPELPQCHTGLSRRARRRASLSIVSLSPRKLQLSCSRGIDDVPAYRVGGNPGLDGSRTPSHYASRLSCNPSVHVVTVASGCPIVSNYVDARDDRHAKGRCK